MEVLHSLKDLVEEFRSIDIIDPVVTHDVVEELACISVLHNEVEFTLCFYDLVELDNSRMTYFL